MPNFNASCEHAAALQVLMLIILSSFFPDHSGGAVNPAKHWDVLARYSMPVGVERRLTSLENIILSRVSPSPSLVDEW